MAAAALEVGLGVLVAVDAGTSDALAWFGTAIAVIILALGLIATWSSAVPCSVGLLAVLLLLRQEDRLLLAPVYGACLLLAAELAQRSAELRRLALIGSGANGARVAAIVVLAALGACAAALAASAVTIAPARSVAFTAIGTVAVLATFAAIVLLARRRGPENPSDEGKVSAARQPAAPRDA